MNSSDASAPTVVQVATTLDSRDAATALARAAVAEHLAACAQVDGPVTRVYRWQGAVTTDDEWRVTFRTTARRAGDLERWIVGHHPYDVPEVLRTPVLDGDPEYLAWVAAEVR